MDRLSDEQMNAVLGASVSAWEPVERPVGPQPLPTWLADAHVDWMNGCANAPHVTLKVRERVRDWPGQRWTREGKDCYIARHDDGRAMVLYHGGAVSESAAWRVFCGPHAVTYQWSVPERLRPGETWLQAAQREGEKHLAWIRANADFQLETHLGVKVDRADCRLETKTVLVTTAQQGFGGSHYDLTMLDGTELILRGPWHGGAPAGYVEVSIHDASSQHAKPNRWDRGRPWFKRSLTAGVYVTEDLFTRAVARYAAHAPLARVRHSYGWRVEPFRAEWKQPKARVYDLEWKRACAKEPAGQFWRVYWDRSERYCGDPCPDVPPYGLRPEAAA